MDQTKDISRMGNVKFSNGNSTHYQSIVHILFLDSDFTDVTLVSEDNRHVSTHRAVLSASSKFFRSMLYTSLQQSMVTYNVEADFDIIQALIKYMYLGHCIVEEDKEKQFYLLAKLWGIDSIQRIDEAKHKKDKGIKLNIDFTDKGQHTSEEKFYRDLKQSSKRKISEAFNESDESDKWGPEKQNLEVSETAPVVQAKISRPTSNDPKNKDNKKEAQNIAEKVVYMTADLAVLAEVERGDLTEMLVTEMKEMSTQCSLCKKDISQANYTRHLNEMHSYRNNYQCPNCSYNTTRKNNMERHTTTDVCPGQNSPEVKCDLCGKNTKNLEGHLKKYRCEKQFSCNMCDDKFRTHTQFRKHTHI